MQANVGDQLLVHSRVVGMRVQTGEIVEVRGADGNPPFVVRFDDGHESLMFPGPECEVLPQH
ncbi:DUF1918 domain-containing protein [Nocardia wallacei]|uniref:DUF1918 domain-containing protein n=1 Tax=Nocardia wallacei TaxID=480035 RepID=UPI0024552BB4|nr:DUF1918 domain-containing protein [Nocardia wallacei]